VWISYSLIAPAPLQLQTRDISIHGKASTKRLHWDYDPDLTNVSGEYGFNFAAGINW